MQLSRAQQAAGVFVRPYLPMGLYPATPFCHEQAAFHVEKDIAFSVVSIRHPLSRDYESKWLDPDEIRLCAALALSIEVGVFCLYPASDTYRLSDSTSRLEDPSFGAEVGALLRDALGNTDRSFYSEPLLPLTPPMEFKTNGAVDSSRAEALFDAIDPTDALLVRGLGALLKGQLLSRHYCFHTEACISLHVAMEASGELIRRRLRAHGKPDSYVDAADYLLDAFGEQNDGSGYFEAFNQDRNRAVHPAPHAGILPEAPLTADDFWDLYDQLVSVYEFLVTGAIRSE